MPDPGKTEGLIKVVYAKWRQGQTEAKAGHPGEEEMACFLEGRLSAQESRELKAHLINCRSCSKILATQARLKEDAGLTVPQEWLELVKSLVARQAQDVPLLEIILKLKENLLELLNTTGDVLVGQELMPAPVLRSRKVPDFKDEVMVLKDFADIRLEAKIENKGPGYFSLTLSIKEKPTAQLIKDVRVTLFKDDIELESYLSDTGKVTFEHVAIGKYSVEI